MNIEIINTGSELLIGSTLNTHGAWIGQELLKLGLRVRRQITIPDGISIRAELKRAFSENDVVIVTGGIGPTSDDITREETALALDLELIEDEFAVRGIEEFFAKRDRPIASCNLRQALSPCGADILPNPNGTAPGIYVPPRLGSSPCAVFLLPGPPNELQPMFHEEVVHLLQSFIDAEKQPTVSVLSFLEIGESDFHEVIDDELEAIEGLEVGYCARPGEIDLRLIGSAEAVEKGKLIALQHFSEQCFTQNEESLEQVVTKLLSEREMKISTAESCTGGAIASRITDISGASEIFTHGFVTYSNQAKEEILDVSNISLEKHGAVSSEVAKEMSDGAMKRSSSDISVSVTGIAGPTGGTENKPVGTVWIGISVKGKETQSLKRFYPQGRLTFKSRVAQVALTEVWKNIKDL